MSARLGRLLHLAVVGKVGETHATHATHVGSKQTDNMIVQNIVVAGKSGAGKQPRIDVLARRYALRQVSTGNIFRETLGAFASVRGATNLDGLWDDTGFAPDATIEKALAPACEQSGVSPSAALLGFKASRYVDNGLFVPDDITNALFGTVFRGASGRGLLLDGYPRTPEQADYLLRLTREAGTRIDLVLLVDNDDDTILTRTVGRRICPNKACGRVFHVIHKPPAADGTCTNCGTVVVQRSDDTEEKVRTRLAEFQTKARPAIDQLVANGVPMVTVPGNLPVLSDEAVEASVLSAVVPLIGA